MKEDNYNYNNSGYNYPPQPAGAPTYAYGQPGQPAGPPTYGYGQPGQPAGAPTYGYGQPGQPAGAPTYGYGQPGQPAGPPTYGYGQPGQPAGAPTYGYGQPGQPAGAPTYGYGQPGEPAGAPTYAYGQHTGQYPEATPYYSDPNIPPVEGKPLYTPQEIADEPNLKRFVKQGYKDVWAAILFLILFIGSIVWGVVNIITYKAIVPDNTKHRSDHKILNVSELTRPLVIVAICSGICILLSLFSVYLMRCVPKQFIYIANLLNALLFAAVAVYAAIKKEWVPCVLMGILGALSLLFLYCARHRIPFAAALLGSSAHVLLNYKAIFLTNILVTITFFVCVCVSFFTMMPPIDRIYHKVGKKTDTVIILVYFFTLYWTSQVFDNVLHVTASGLVATWYFAGLGNMPSNPTLASFSRAITTSLGSICFGSLFVAIIQFIHALVDSSKGNDGFVNCILDCILNCIEAILEYFNTYAFVYVAIYGCGFIDASKRTFQLFSQSLCKALVNDCLVGPTLKIASLGMSLILGVAAGLIDWNVATGIVTFIICLFIIFILLSPITSAVVTIFVCFAEVPDALERSDPKLYQKIRDADAELNQDQ